MLTIVMYHYVRDLARSRFPRIKGRTIDDFEGQLAFIARNYTVCSMDDVLAAIGGAGSLPANACLLTFDDGLIDHFDVVFPRLVRRGWTGAFFPPADPILNRRVLDVHKLHFVLASCEDAEALTAETLTLLKAYRSQAAIEGDDALRRKYTAASRFDPPSIVFLKRLLQHGLPGAIRASLVGELFRRHVTEEEQAFAREIYVTLPQLRDMAKAGMYIGGHGDRHVWLGHESRDGQKREIQATMEFLRQVYDRAPRNWVMCYPYGSYNDRTIELLQEAGCVAGLTTEVGVNSSLASPFKLARLDTNDLPTAPQREPEASIDHTIVPVS